MILWLRSALFLLWFLLITHHLSLIPSCRCWCCRAAPRVAWHRM